jgi:hypothetical protein
MAARQRQPACPRGRARAARAARGVGSRSASARRGARARPSGGLAARRPSGAPPARVFRAWCLGSPTTARRFKARPAASRGVESVRGRPLALTRWRWRPHMSQVSTSRDAAAPARRRVRQARRTEAANPGAGRSRRRTAVPSRRRRTVWAAWRAESPSAHGRSVTSASRQGGRAGGPGVGKRARKAASGHRLSRSSATRRSRWPLGKAARATRAVSEGRGSMGLGRRLVHLHVYTRNLRDAEASSQCSKDFASSISFGDEGRRGHTSVGAGQEWWMTSAGSCRR